jgi:hypothetical protein
MKNIPMTLMIVFIRETENNKESMLKDLALIMVKLQLLAPCEK